MSWPIANKICFPGSSWPSALSFSPWRFFMLSQDVLVYWRCKGNWPMPSDQVLYQLRTLSRKPNMDLPRQMFLLLLLAFTMNYESLLFSVLWNVWPGEIVKVILSTSKLLRFLICSLKWWCTNLSTFEIPNEFWLQLEDALQSPPLKSILYPHRRSLLDEA